VIPSVVPSVVPTVTPTDRPSTTPTVIPSQIPTVVPTPVPSVTPTFLSTAGPTTVPTATPSFAPTAIYQININSGYQVGMTSTKHVFPVITVIPFGIALVLLIGCCLCMRRGGNTELFSTGRTGMILAIVVMVLSCVQFAINLAGYIQVSEPHVGSWWIGIAAFFPSLFATLFSSNYKMTAFSTVLLVCAGMIGLICTIGDGLFYSHVLRGIEACTNINGHSYGDSDYFSFSIQCLSEDPTRDLACIHRNNERCYYFEGITNGDYFFTSYTRIMEAGFVFDIVLMTSLFLFIGWQLFCLFSLESFFYNYLHLDKMSPKHIELFIVDDKDDEKKAKADLESAVELVVITADDNLDL
jgi:hypothetical protein